MKVRLDGVRRIVISSEYIKLDSLLKFASVVSTGSEAKALIKSGCVYVGDKLCYERGKKIRHGDTVRFDNDVMLIKKSET